MTKKATTQLKKTTINFVNMLISSSHSMHLYTPVCALVCVHVCVNISKQCLDRSLNKPRIYLVKIKEMKGVKMASAAN